ncbi:MAG: hypothetical protein JG781_992 [Peptococcaceae bacterium]|jgi:hypothetical protein|nr:hypothetical protein [Peptococcaceae bacterium]
MENLYTFSDVKARVEEPQFWTYHWVLEVPGGLYERVLKNYPGDIYTEQAVQEFVIQYLRWKGDSGIVGLVGLERNKDGVLIDAAVRYPQRRY